MNKTLQFFLLGGAVLGLYLMTRPSISITRIDKLNKSVSYTFKGQEYTHKYGDLEVGISDGTYSVVIKNINNAIPGIQVTLMKGADYIKQETIWFN